jgi:lipoyl-dependent peroxiredoxin
MKRTASAVWTGDLKQGKGAITLESGALRDAPYGFDARFESGAGTNPEELIAAAHAGCFTMACSAALTKAGFVPEKLSTTAAVEMTQVEGNWTITAVHLTLQAKVPKVTVEKFAEISGAAKTNCPVSRALNAKVTLDAKLL